MAEGARPQRSRWAAFLAVATLAGCAPANVKPSAPAIPIAELRHSNTYTPSMLAVRYDRAQGRCSEGTLQMLARPDFDALVTAWSKSDPLPKDGTCTAPGVERMPERTDYPCDPQGGLQTGAAQILVLVERDGTPQATHPVCATSEAFGRSAAQTAKQLTYSPVRCSGQPGRAVLMVPLEFDPH